MEPTKKQKAKPDDKLDKEDNKCRGCLKAVLEQENGVMCEICNNWYHCKCQGINDQLYRILNQYGTELHWFCKGCQAGADKLLALLTRMQTKIDKMDEEIVRVRTDIRSEMTSTFQQMTSDLHTVNHRCDDHEKKIDECRHEMNTINRRCDEHEKRLDEYRKEMNTMLAEKLPDMVTQINNENKPSWSEIVAKEVDTKMSDFNAEFATLQQQTKIIQEKREQEEIHRRKTNLILHGMKEPSDVNGAKEEDENNIQDLLHTIGCEDVSVESITRLGSKTDEQEAKPRLIKLVLASEGQKVKVLGKSKNLRSHTNNRFATVFMHQDLTPLQRDRRRKLLQELKTRQEQGEENLILRNWKIVNRLEHQEA